ncbi:hypothetical protein B0H13DRAFT_1907027 [Mycena leptocephala]|nr:hypothetical protein B0H13DRAFT_1907027 [Mycena leptocephala]
MQENTSNPFGSIYSSSWDKTDANNYFGEKFVNPIQDGGNYSTFTPDNIPQELFLPTNPPGANNYSGEYFMRPIPNASSIENLHQRLLWVSTVVLGWQLERDHQYIPPTSSEASECESSELALSPVPLRASTLARRSPPRDFKNGRIIAERARGQGKQYQVVWDGRDLNHFAGLSGTALKRKGAILLAKWETQKQLR